MCVNIYWWFVVNIDIDECEVIVLLVIFLCCGIVIVLWVKYGK